MMRNRVKLTKLSFFDAKLILTIWMLKRQPFTFDLVDWAMQNHCHNLCNWKKLGMVLFWMQSLPEKGLQDFNKSSNREGKWDNNSSVVLWKVRW